jgi:hypothetical protein
VLELGGQPLASPLGLTGPADQHPGDRGVTGQPLAGLRVQGSGPAPIPTNGPWAAQEAVQVHGDQQLRADPTTLGELAGFQVAAGQLGQGVGATLAGATGVLGAGGAGEGVQGGQQGLAGLGVELALEGDHALDGRGQPQPASVMTLVGPVTLAVRSSDLA